MPATAAENIMVIRRKGNFAVTNTGSNKNQCGPLGTQVLSYFVSIATKAYRLNGQGFIIDNNDIQNYFTKKFSNVNEFVSCENVAQTACEDFRKMFGHGSKNATKVYGICVVITGLPGTAELECSWVRDGYENNTRMLMGLRPGMTV